MKRFLFYFGYNTPSQWQENEEHGRDDEFSAGFIVVAPSAEAALTWGAEIAEALVGMLFRRANWSEPIPSWRKVGFAHWIDESEEAEVQMSTPGQFAVVQAGEWPDFGAPEWQDLVG